MDILNILNDLNIKYEILSHQAVYTVEEAKQIENMIEGVGCKNLFLKDKHKNYYIFVLEENKRANLKELANYLKLSKLSFATPEELKVILNLEPGSVTPLSIINDKENLVTLILDQELNNNKILVHPNTNTKTVSLLFEDLIKFIEYTNHKYIIYKD
ncbi:MAG: prolyl-tRNA synthetase associated domain-containing protein [Bacilli bacterium]|nr:prolyl-tRNA synthetase associated domain-containing protein [Bacilli bacterium]